MLNLQSGELLGRPADMRPALLAGRWLGKTEDCTLAAVGPVSVLEGRAEALEELPVWIARHTQQFPEGTAVGFLSYELARFLKRSH